MARPVFFIHGLWLHATSWQPWADLFASAGYEPSAPGWPHEAPTVAEARENPEAVANLSIDEITNHYADSSPVSTNHRSSSCRCSWSRESPFRMPSVSPS